MTPGSGTGSLRIPRLSARIAGGEVRGDLLFRLGDDQSFNANLQLASLELETLTRIASTTSQPASGRITGRVTLTGPNPAEPGGFKGRVTLDLSDASLVQIPVFREIDRFLGSASGGIFEDGDLVGVVVNKNLMVETLTLAGRLAQVHGTGTVGFDGRLNLEMLVNTSQIIPQTGQALVILIPGLREVVGLSRLATGGSPPSWQSPAEAARHRHRPQPVGRDRPDDLGPRDRGGVLRGGAQTPSRTPEVTRPGGQRLPGLSAASSAACRSCPRGWVGR